MSKLISIIVPIYKVPKKLLLNCVNSCINQTFKDIEIILVDDGSPDKCGEICEDLKKKDERIVVIHQENKGLSGARNTGVKNASGEWIIFLDGDDYVDVKMCETLYNCTKEEKIDVVCCEYVSEKNGKELEKCQFNGIEEKIYKNEECKFLQEKILDFNAHFSSSWGKLIRKKFLIENNIFHNEELKQGAEDLEFTIRLFEYTKTVFVKKSFLFHYVYNENSITKKHNEKNQELQLRCFEAIKDFIEKNSNKEKLLESFYNRMAYIIITVAVSGYFSKSNDEPFKVRKEKYLKYLEKPLVKESMKKCNIAKLDIKRKIMLTLIKLKMFRTISILIKIFR